MSNLNSVNFVLNVKCSVHFPAPATRPSGTPVHRHPDVSMTLTAVTSKSAEVYRRVT